MAAAQFRQIAEAYETLSDPDAPAALRQRRAGRSAGAEASTFGFDGLRLLGQRQRARRRRPSAICSPTCCPAAAAAGRQRPERGADLHQSSRSFEEAMRGGQRHGHGDAAGAAARARAPGRCTPPSGPLRALPRRRRGEVGARPHGVLEAVRALRRQPAGSGRRAARPAAGRQVEMRTESLTINVPRGLADGARIRVAGQGARRAEAAARPAISTSTVAVEPHPLFRRDGDDLHVVVPVARARGGARRENRGAVARRPGAAARPAGHAVGPAVPAARARRAVAARRRARRSGGRGAAGAAAAARRAIEGAAAGVRHGSTATRLLATRTMRGVVEACHEEAGKAYYMISAVAQKYNIHPQTLRLYEREGLLKPSRTEATRACTRKKISSSSRRSCR